MPARIILVLQLTIIIALSAWTLLEYQNNQYLQAYIKDSMQTNALTFQMAIPALLVATTVTVYAKLLMGKRKVEDNTLGELASISQSSTLPRMTVQQPVARESAEMPVLRERKPRRSGVNDPRRRRPGRRGR